jgi:hypothetical protein
MTTQISPLVSFYKPGWENYQQAIVKTIAPLPSEQLALPVASHYLSIGGLLTHTHGLHNEMHDQTKWLSTVFRPVVLSGRTREFHPFASKQTL